MTTQGLTIREVALSADSTVGGRADLPHLPPGA